MGNRAWEINKSARSVYWTRVKEKYGVKIELAFEDLTEEEAFQCEKDTILEFKYFNYPLVNHTTGGEGSAGLKFTDAQRLKIQESLKGRVPWNKTFDEKHETKKRPCATGNKNHFADKSVYNFVRLSDGFEFSGTRSDLCEKFGANRSLIKKLFYTQPRKSSDGWRLKEKIND